MTDEDQVIFSLFDMLPRRLPTQKLLKLFLCTQRWVDLSGMYTFVFVLFSTIINLNKFPCVIFAEIMAQEGLATTEMFKKLNLEKAQRTKDWVTKASTSGQLLLLLLIPLGKILLLISSPLWPRRKIRENQSVALPLAFPSRGQGPTLLRRVVVREANQSPMT